MKTQLIIFMVMLSPCALWSDPSDTKSSAPIAETVKPEQLPSRVTEILRKLKTLKKGHSFEGVLHHLGLDTDKRVIEIDSEGGLGEQCKVYDLGVDQEWVLVLNGAYQKIGDELVEPAKIYSATLQKGSVQDFHEKGGDVDWKVILPYWANGDMAYKLDYHSSDTILVQGKDTEQGAP